MKTTIIQYRHFPNTTELGMGNTHETYMLIPSWLDLSSVFPDQEEVTVRSNFDSKLYKLKSAFGNEFRVNQMGSIYRDYGVKPGDDILFTQICQDNNKFVLFEVTNRNAVLLVVSSKGVELHNVERLADYKIDENDYVVNLGGNQNGQKLEIKFDKKEKKRADSPIETDYYSAINNGNPLKKGSYILNLSNEPELIDFEKCEYNTVELDDSAIMNNPYLAKKMPDKKSHPLQQIWYGAPGTGKSHEIKEQTAGKAVVRTTFHPDSDYSTFVGAYKPVMDEVDVKVTPVVTTGGVSFSPASDMKEKRISYRFVKQAFMKAYLGAWKKYADNPQNPEPQYLVIEEINRGNCAQIFGDIFQLLDRGGNGFSEYPIEADEDLRQEIARSFAEENDYKLSADLAVDDMVENYTSNYGATLSEDIQQGRVLLLPSNLYIWATMNTSDQSLFPIDSAFKRRWEWKYMSIKDCSEGYKIVLGNGKEYDWYEFISKMNGLIAEKTDSEDKQMGYFFIKAEGGKISADRFVNKVLFYLYNDVFKSYELPTQFGNKKFTAFFTDTDTKVAELLDDLDVKKLNEPDSAEASEDTAEE